MGDVQHLWVFHSCNPRFCAGPHCWIFCRTPLDVGTVSAVGSCLLLVVFLELLGLLHTLRFDLLSPLSASGHFKIILRTAVPFFNQQKSPELQVPFLF